MKEVHFSFRAMGGKNEIHLYSPPVIDQNALVNDVIDLVSFYEKKYSRFQKDSFISRVNAAAGQDRIALDDESASLLQYASACNSQSNGLFDITSGVLRKVWDFQKRKVPTQDELSSVKKLIGWFKVSITADGIFLPIEGMEIDMGGIVKEYASDTVASLLRSKKINNALINLGGDIHILGPKADSKPWKIGIQHPRKEGSTIASISMLHGAMATSGDYERFFEVDGHRYCHIMNPKSGMPVADLQSVTVCAQTCLVAGSLSTIAMLLGEVRGLAALRDSGLPFLLVNRKGEIISNGPFEMN